MDAPGMLHLAAGLMIAGSLFETIQNTLDRWFLNAETPSFYDCLFGTSICLALASIVVACFGNHQWLPWLAYSTALLFPVMYIARWPAEVIRGALGAASVASLYWTLRDPVVLLSLVSVFLTVYFFRLLMKTQAQSLHGVTTIVNVLGAVAIPWAIVNVANGTLMPWWQLLVLATTLVGGSLAAYPWLAKLTPTPRREQTAIIS